MSEATLISYAQNGEDVVLWRALSGVANGRYVDVGACDPVDLSVTKALYDRGWRGIDIDAVPEYAERFRSARPGNEVLNVAVTDRPVDTVRLHQLVGTGLSTLIEGTAEAHEAAGFTRREVIVPAATLDSVCEGSALLEDGFHVLKIDVEGAEVEVLRSFDLERWRPWVVVVEATLPLSDEPSYEDWEPLLLDAGYVFTLFDGVSRFYVSPDHPELATDLAYPACSLDDYVPARQHDLDVRVARMGAEIDAARRDVVRWRNEAVTYWANAVAKAQHSEDAAKEARSEAERLRGQLARTRANLEQARAERKQLRQRLKQRAARIERMEGRIERLSARAEAAEAGRVHGDGSLVRRLRGVARKVAGT